jgi:predicted Fe-Mo cluster-binding NifX family protein
MNHTTMNFKNAVIAIATDDGLSVSSHFGQASFYEVLTFSNGIIIHRERRKKHEHHSYLSADSDHEHHHEGHEQRHQAMVSSIPDCLAVVAHGMGQGAVEHLHQSNLLPVLTELRTIDEVIEAVGTDSLVSDPRRIHASHGHR